jgi:thiol-disulfide isomerase/thioredoxin
MKTISRLAVLLLAQILLFSCSGQNSGSRPSVESTPSAGQTATGSLPFPVFEKFADLEPLFHQKNDTTYVINFWATWCIPCVSELPFFEKLNTTSQGKPVKVILVSMDFPKQLESKLLPFLQEHNLKAQVIALADMDYNSWIDKVSEKWDGAIPFTLIYNQRHREIKLGEMDNYEELQGLVEGVMK